MLDELRTRVPSETLQEYYGIVTQRMRDHLPTHLCLSLLTGLSSRWIPDKTTIHAAHFSLEELSREEAVHGLHVSAFGALATDCAHTQRSAVMETKIRGLEVLEVLSSSSFLAFFNHIGPHVCLTALTIASPLMPLTAPTTCSKIGRWFVNTVKFPCHRSGNWHMMYNRSRCLRKHETYWRE